MEIIIRLPKIEDCKRIFKAISVIDAIIMPEWEYRYYSFNSKWDTNQMMASMRDGSGNSFFSLFTEAGLIIKGFDKNHVTTLKNVEIHEMDVYKDVPGIFNEFLNEPAFDIENTTFCVWNQKTKEIWEASKQYKEEELDLLMILITKAKGYVDWASEYYEKEIPFNVVKDIFDGKPINQKMICLLNPDSTFAA